jgi:hypothetical protein
MSGERLSDARLNSILRAIELGDHVPDYDDIASLVQEAIDWRKYFKELRDEGCGWTECGMAESGFSRRYT